MSSASETLKMETRNPSGAEYAGREMLQKIWATTNEDDERLDDRIQTQSTTRDILTLRAILCITGFIFKQYHTSRILYFMQQILKNWRNTSNKNENPDTIDSLLSFKHECISFFGGMTSFFF